MNLLVMIYESETETEPGMVHPYHLKDADAGDVADFATKAWRRLGRTGKPIFTWINMENVETWTKGKPALMDPFVRA